MARPRAENQWWNPVPYLSKKADEHAARLNFVYRQLIDPCDAPFTVWVWSFWRALGHAVLGVIAIDVKQMVRSSLRPSLSKLRKRSVGHWQRGEKHNRPGKGKKNYKFENLDYNDRLGRELHEFLELEPTVIADGELALWTIIDVFELAVFYYMVFDIAVDFIYEGMRGVAQSKYCQARDDAVLLASAPGYPLLAIFGWDAMGILDAVKQRKVQFFNGFGAALDFGPVQILASFTATNGSGTNPNTVSYRLRCLTGPRAGLINENAVTLPGGGQATIGIQAVGNGGETWICEIKVTDSAFIGGPALNMHAVYNGN